MQDQVVSTAQVRRIRDDLIRVLNASVLCYAPGLVTKDFVTVPTGRIRAGLVAVAQRKLVFYGHWLLPRQWSINWKRGLVLPLVHSSCLSLALPPIGIGSDAAWLHFWSQSESASHGRYFWSSLVLINNDIWGILAPRRSSPHGICRKHC